MKIRNRHVLAAGAKAAACLVRAWIGTLRYRYHAMGIDCQPWVPNLTQNYLYAFWHENMLLPAYQFSCPNVHVLISEHRDGQFIADVIQSLGLSVVRGSTTRGGMRAVRQMIELAKTSHLVLTPDGPRGPRRNVQAGLAYISVKTGLPIVPVGVAYSRCWRAKSWDRMAMPHPFSTGYLVVGEPMVLPPVENNDEWVALNQRVQQAMDDATYAAEQWQLTGIHPTSTPGPTQQKAA